MMKLEGQLPQRKKKPLCKRNQYLTDEREEKDEEEGVAADSVGAFYAVAANGKTEICSGVCSGFAVVYGGLQGEKVFHGGVPRREGN